MHSTPEFERAMDRRCQALVSKLETLDPSLLPNCVIKIQNYPFIFDIIMDNLIRKWLIEIQQSDWLVALIQNSANYAVENYVLKTIDNGQPWSVEF